MATPMSGSKNYLQGIIYADGTFKAKDKTKEMTVSGKYIQGKVEGDKVEFDITGMVEDQGYLTGKPGVTNLNFTAYGTRIKFQYTTSGITVISRNRAYSTKVYFDKKLPNFDDRTAKKWEWWLYFPLKKI